VFLKLGDLGGFGVVGDVEGDCLSERFYQLVKRVPAGEAARQVEHFGPQGAIVLFVDASKRPRLARRRDPVGVEHAPDVAQPLDRL
jgi:hypothetical protein